MIDEFEDLSSRIPDFGAAIAQRIATRNGTLSNINPPPGTVDPYKLMLQRKREINNPGEIDPNTIQKWPDESVKELQDYCSKMGIVGFNSGKLHPSIALKHLKQQVGDYSDVPLDKRVPEGYEKMGTHSKYSVNYPYSEAMNKKQIIHG